MYRIRLPSGREAEFATIEELALALQRGEVSRETLIYHRRSEQWVPIGQHPRFQGQVEADEADEADASDGSDTSRRMSAEDAARDFAQHRHVTPAPAAPTPAAPTPVEPTPVEPAPVPPVPAPGPARDVPRVAHEPVAPTPLPPPSPIRTHAAPPVAPTPYPVRPPPPSEPSPHAAPPLSPRPMAADATRAPAHRGDGGSGPKGPGLLRRLARLVFFLAMAGGAYFAWNRWGETLLAGRGSAAPGFEAAPPPSTLLRDVPADSAAAPAPASATRAVRSDPRAPVAVGELIARHAATVAASRGQLASEMETIGFPNVFSPISFASPLGARAARRRIASALNVIGQFHRRSVLLDQAYGDTASFQAGRAWSAADRERWDTRPTLREPYASADLAESLLADADSLLAILGHAPQFELRGDTVAFGDPARAAAYEAQRQRFLERIGPPVEDFDRRPTLFLVRRSLDPARPPAPLP
ncbi:MAG TPA: hypothetical protein VFT04_14540 [Gemmatimonadales bacterium]|nr:hypothetical protein [Gemmatimonadales bacterium]